MSKLRGPGCYLCAEWRTGGQSKEELEEFKGSTSKKNDKHG
jgi:hypothetical protein